MSASLDWLKEEAGRKPSFKSQFFAQVNGILGAAQPAVGAVRPAPNLAAIARFAQEYITAVDQNGNINANALTGNTRTDQTKIIWSYAAEFLAGGRVEDAQTLARAMEAIRANPDSAGNTFRLVAATFKNGNGANGVNGNYNNGNLDRLLQSTGNADLADKPGVGNKDVETLAAVSEAIDRGTLRLSQIFNTETGLDANGNRSVQDKDAYNVAISYVRNGYAKRDIEAVAAGGEAPLGNVLRSLGKGNEGRNAVATPLPGSAAANAATPPAATPPPVAATAQSNAAMTALSNPALWQQIIQAMSSMATNKPATVTNPLLTTGLLNTTTTPVLGGVSTGSTSLLDSLARSTSAGVLGGGGGGVLGSTVSTGSTSLLDSLAKSTSAGVLGGGGGGGVLGTRPSLASNLSTLGSGGMDMKSMLPIIVMALIASMGNIAPTGGGTTTSASNTTIAKAVTPPVGTVGNAGNAVVGDGY